MHTVVMRWLASLLAVVCLMGLTGCGTNLNDALYQATDVAGRTVLDLFLTDFENALADLFGQQDTPSSGDGLGGGAPPSDGPPLEDLTGDPGAGESIFISNSCAACHCADATGGCALNAPSLVGEAIENLDDRLRGDAAHPGGKFNFTNQEIVDLQAYLASLDTNNG